ncbi:MAG: hypothetical protein UZ21_OP11001000313 [Microgenomates bacterium OLB22]|nr:MAG: hypothetical protein UZ21_OP11001000313 [Microgenomates bacterium OLB22]
MVGIYEKKGNFLTDMAGMLAQKIRADESPKTVFTLDYTKEGALKEDLKACYEYNREGQLMALKRKEKEGKGCGSDIKFTTVTYFYYNHKGALVLTEDYRANDLNKALKKDLPIWGL